MNLTPVEFIFLGLLVGAFLLGSAAALGYLLWRLVMIERVLKTLNDTVANVSLGQFTDSVRVIAQCVPQMVAGIDGLTSVMGIFNKAVTGREERTSASAQATQVLENESVWTPYDEREAAVKESQRMYKEQTGVDLLEAEARMDRRFKEQVEGDKGAAFFASPGKFTPPTVVPRAPAPTASVEIESAPTAEPKIMEPPPQS